jgi:hypothetical protein
VPKSGLCGYEADRARCLTAFRTLAAVVIAGMAIVSLLDVPDGPRMIDHQVYLTTHGSMRAGDSYYPAMASALEQVYGTPVAPRDFRWPTVFWMWQPFPDEDALWFAFVALSVATGLFVTLTSSMPLTGAVISLYMLRIGSFPSEIGDIRQFLTVELWAMPLLLVTCSLLQHQRQGAALVAGLAATLVREQAVLVLVGLLLFWKWKTPSRRWQPVSALAIAAAVYAVHVVSTLPFLDPKGAHTPLWLDGHRLGSFVDMASFGIVATWIGMLAWIVAVWSSARGNHPRQLLPILMLPLVGLFVERPYWGVLVVPIALVVSLEVATNALVRYRDKQCAGWR